MFLLFVKLWALGRITLKHIRLNPSPKTQSKIRMLLPTEPVVDDLPPLVSHAGVAPENVVGVDGAFNAEAGWGRQILASRLTLEANSRKWAWEKGSSKHTASRNSRPRTDAASLVRCSRPGFVSLAPTIFCFGSFRDGRW